LAFRTRACITSSGEAFLDLLVASALSPEKSLALIEALAQDYTHEEHP
jgi:hypothetical protein